MAIQKESLLLAAQTALLGSITPELLAVWVDAEGTKVRVRAYVERELSEEERDDLESVGTEIIAGLPTTTSLDVEILENAKSPLEQPDSGSWAFVRSGCAIRLSKEQESRLLRKAHS